jgi:hypothetical protein
LYAVYFPDDELAQRLGMEPDFTEDFAEAGTETIKSRNAALQKAGLPGS